MVDADEGGVGDDVEALLAAVVGMRPPADVGKQAGGVAQSALGGRLGQAESCDEAIRPGAQLLAMGGRAGAALASSSRRSNSRPSRTPSAETATSRGRPSRMISSSTMAP
jgi:hypothetical protein